MLVALLVATCNSAAGPTGNSPRAPRTASPPIVYAAIGASETVGVGAAEPTHDAWPQVLFRTAFPQSAIFYNFGIPGATVATALSEEVPEALTVQPTLVTVWLNVDDLIGGESAPAFEAELDQLISALRRGGQARVLVANTPYLDRLPVYLECRAGTPTAGVRCPPVELPAPSVLNAAVDGYNQAIAQVAQREGAVVVDLHAQGEVADLHPDSVSSDGFHPSTSGYAAIAAEFAAALKSTHPQP
ncbi:MAG: SGNH/GDSL hydrolase family protein [Candidatus Dormibacteraceae bacterium]